MPLFEFWPEYGSGPLWTDRGVAVDLEELGLPSELVDQLQVWNSRYVDEMLPIDGGGEREWLGQGRRLLLRTRDALGPDFEVVVTEPWWEEGRS